MTMTLCAKPIASSDSIPSNKDAVWIPREDAKYGLSRALQAQALEEKITQKEKDISELTQRINDLKKIILLMQDKDKLNQSVTKSYEKEIKEMKEIRTLYEKDVEIYKKEIKKLKGGKFWTAMAGAFATAAAFFIGLQF